MRLKRAAAVLVGDEPEELAVARLVGRGVGHRRPAARRGSRVIKPANRNAKIGSTFMAMILPRRTGFVIRRCAVYWPAVMTPQQIATAVKARFGTKIIALVSRRQASARARECRGLRELAEYLLREPYAEVRLAAVPFAAWITSPTTRCAACTTCGASISGTCLR